MSRSLPFAVVAMLLVSGCAATAKRAPAPAVDTNAAPVASAPADALPLANDNLNAVAWTQTAIERDLIYRQAYRAAQDQLVRALKDARWDALPQGERKTALKGIRKKAVILDIDETVLDNSPYQARLVKQGTNYDEFTWAEWCREEIARPVPGALEFTRFAASKGVTLFYLSNRARDLRDVTISNLRKVGFPVATNEEVFLGLGTVVSDCEQNGSEKGCRRELISRDYRVLMQVGDQLGDFVDVLANTPEGRRQAVEPYLDWIGERWFVLPNPTYGSWEPALFNNDWRAPAGERRKAKLDALHTD
jgi:acid phosphatase